MDKKETKKKEDLIFPLIFGVETADYETIPIRDSSPRFSSSISGTSSILIMRVIAQDQTPSYHPIKELEFEGYCNIQKGDRVRAYVPKYAEQKDESTGIAFSGQEQFKTIYIERPFNHKEKIFRLDKLDKDYKLLATFKGI